MKGGFLRTSTLSLGWYFAQISLSIWVGIRVWGAILWRIADISVILRKGVQFFIRAKCKASHSDYKVLVKLLYLMTRPNIAL